MKEAIEALIAQKNHQTVFDTLGITIEKLDADETICALSVDHRHLQHLGMVHGGIYVLLAESAASIAAACTLKDQDTYVVALEINANHLLATKQGMLRATTKSLHAGRSTLVYDIRVTNQENRLVSIARSTLMVVSSNKPLKG